MSELSDKIFKATIMKMLQQITMNTLETQKNESTRKPQQKNKRCKRAEGKFWK